MKRRSWCGRCPLSCSHPLFEDYFCGRCDHGLILFLLPDGLILILLPEVPAASENPMAVTGYMTERFVMNVKMADSWRGGSVQVKSDSYMSVQDPFRPGMTDAALKRGRRRSQRLNTMDVCYRKKTRIVIFIIVLEIPPSVELVGFIPSLTPAHNQGIGYLL